MCLEDVGTIALPEYFSSLLNYILRQIPAITVTVHTHLHSSVSLIFHLWVVDYAYSLDKAHDKTE